MAVTFDGGVVLGADSRTSSGAYVVNRVSDKLTQVHDRIMCCRSGSAADTQAIADVVQYYLQVTACALFTCALSRTFVAQPTRWRGRMENGEAPDVRTAATFFQDLCYQNKDRFQAGIILAGWDKFEGGQVYNIPLGGSIHKQPFAIGGARPSRPSSAALLTSHSFLPAFKARDRRTFTATAMPTIGTG